MRELQASEPLVSTSRPSDGDAIMKEMWETAAKEFEKICGESLTRGEMKSFEDVQKRIEKASYGPDAGPEDKWDKAKNVGLQSLKYLKMLVGAVSQVSSFTPIPAVAANVTSSALAFVFDIPQAIKGYNDAVDQVFSEVSSALSQFQIYGSMEKIDPALAKQIHLVLTSFVKLCAHVVKYRQGSRRARLLRHLKSVFDDDSGLSDEMTEFKRVLQQQRDIEGTLTLAAVVETKHDVAILLERFIVFGKTVDETHQAVQDTQKGVQALKDDADRMKTLTKIRDTLGVPQRVRLDAKTTQTLTSIAERCLPGTGDWIWTHETYLAWTAAMKDREASASSSHILLVSGPSSSGKTSASALITRRLEERKEEDRTYVAHYFFPASTQKSVSKNNVASALKYMAFQIARVDATVRNTLSKACDAKDASAAFRRLDDNLEALWGELKIGVPGSGPIYYLVFNGLEYLPDDQAELLLKFAFSPKLAGDPAGRVRVLLSGTDDRFVSATVPVGSALRFRLEENNEPDMRIIVKDALAKRGMLQNTRPDSNQQRAYDKIVEKLPKNVKGSYSLLQFGLDDVMRLLSTRSAARDLDDLLDQSMSSHEAAIKALQRSLTAEEIGELNELLKWVLFSNEPLTLDQLEAVMFLFSDTESLASLQYIIKHKYAAVLKLEDSDYVFGQDGVKDYLQKERDAASRSSYSADQPTISMSIKINNVSQELCAHFLWDLAHKSIRDKFKFDFDGDSSNGLVSGGGRGAIRVDEFDAHHTIVQRAFRFLNSPPQEQTAKIGKYLVCWLPYHLNRLRELEDEDKGRLMPDEQAEIGRNLYMLFRDGEILKRHQDSFMQTYWLASEMKDLQKWVMDSAVTRKLDKQWRDEVQRASAPTKGMLKELVTTVVKGLLRERSWNVQNATWWLEEFVTAEVDDTKPDDSPMSWERVTAWCQNFLGLPETDLDSLWYERLAQSHTEGKIYVDPQTIISLWQRSIEEKDPSWLSHRGLAEAYSRQDQIGDAIDQMKLALKAAEREGALPKPETKDIMDLNMQLGTFTFQIGDLTSSADYYLVAGHSEDAEQAKKAQLGYLEARVGSPDAQGARQLLKDALAAEGGIDRVAGILQTVATDPKHDTFMAKIFTVARSDQDLMRNIARAMQTATLPPDDKSRPVEDNQHFTEHEVRGILLYDRGVASYFYGAVAPDGTSSTRPEPVNEALRLWQACRNQLSNVGGPNAFTAHYEAAAAVAGHFFRNLLDGKHGDRYFAELEKLATEAGIDTWSPGCDAIGYLGILHMLNGDADKARAVLLPRFRYSLQVLSDDTPDNDRVGFSTLHKTLEHYQDYKNAAIALTFLGQPDLVVDALRFEDVTNEAEELAMQYVTLDGETVEAEAGHDKLLDDVRLAAETIDAVRAAVPEVSAEGLAMQPVTLNGEPEDAEAEDPVAPYRRWVEARHDKLLDTVNRLAAETITAAHKAVPEVSEQLLRVEAARSHINPAFEAAAAAVPKMQRQPNPEDDQGAVEDADVASNQNELEITAVAHGIVQNRLQGAMWPITWWTCDGRAHDGSRCTNKADSERDFYHCMYCSNRDFCRECLARIRDPEAEVKITVCDSKHRWLRIPPQGDDLFVGVMAKSVRVPEGMKPVDGDERIFEIRYAEDAPIITVEEWKEGLAKEWGIKMEEVTGTL
ncbi:hypothetical protein FB45DRAFT_930509, partial [Roridomyces roridus]